METTTERFEVGDFVVFTGQIFEIMGFTTLQNGDEYYELLCEDCAGGPFNSCLTQKVGRPTLHRTVRPADWRVTRPLVVDTPDW